MATGGKQSKWVSTAQVLPKIVQETILYPDEDSIESVSSYMYSENSDSIHEEISFLDGSILLTFNDLSLEKTQVLTARDSVFNIHACLESFKTREVVKIQRFMKKKQMKYHVLKLADLLALMVKKQEFQKNFEKIKIWAKVVQRSALLIQKNWRNYKMENRSRCMSPTRKLLHKAIAIGSKIKKLNSMITFISQRRVSPERLSHKSLLYKRRAQLIMRAKSSYSINGLTNSLFSDDSDTLETISTPVPESIRSRNLSRNSVDITCTDWENSDEKSLIMPKRFKVRTKKQQKKELSFQEISCVFAVDLEMAQIPKIIVADSCIPQFSQNSKFFVNTDWTGKKEVLMNDYKDLLVN